MGRMFHYNGEYSTNLLPCTEGHTWSLGACIPTWMDLCIPTASRRLRDSTLVFEKNAAQKVHSMRCIKQIEFSKRELSKSEDHDIDIYIYIMMVWINGHWSLTALFVIVFLWWFSPTINTPWYGNIMEYPTDPLKLTHYIWLVVGPPLWKIWKSIGMMKFPIYRKIKLMFQTTNQ